MEGKGKSWLYFDGRKSKEKSECVFESVSVWERETINVKSFGDKLRRMGCVWEEAAALRVHLVHGKVYGYCWKRERKWAIS